MSGDTAILVVVLLRFIVPLLIPRFPLPAILACLVIDAADQTIFQLLTDRELLGYQTYDKALDVYYLAIAYFSTMRNWRDPFAFEVARWLYLYRLVGVALFEMLDARWLLLVFANTFEYFFIAYEAIRTRWSPRRLTPRNIVVIAAAIWIFVKLPQELWIHVLQLDFTDFMAARPFMWIVLGAGAAGVGVGLWMGRDRIPAADWSFTVRVDTHLEGDVTPSGSGPRRRFLNEVLIEKVVLMTLVSVIFAQLLPTLRASNLGVAVGVVLLVTLNAAITQWLWKDASTWASTSREFLAVLAVNAAIVFVDALIGSRARGRTPNLNTLFLVVLLSLLIALFDRYRSTRVSLASVSLSEVLRSARSPTPAT